MSGEARFSKKTFDFLAEAGTQKSPLWLDKNAGRHEKFLVEPLRELASHLADGLKDVRGYKFPKRGFGRLRRPSHKIQPGQVAYRSWVHLQASRPSASRFDDNPGLYFYLSAEDVFAGGGLYMPSSRQIKQLRAWIADGPDDLVKVLKARSFKAIFPRGLAADKMLKTFPRNYPPDHRRIDWLRLQAFYIKREYSKKEFYSREFKDLVLANWRQTVAFNETLYGALAADIWVPAAQAVEPEQGDEPETDLWDDRL